MILNGVAIESANQSGTSGTPPLQISPILVPSVGYSYAAYGLQPASAPSIVRNLNCTQANLHVVTSAEIPVNSQAGVQTSSVTAVNRKTAGTLLNQNDLPITILTDSSNVIRACFGGSAENICVPPATLASANNLVVSSACVDNSGTSATVTWNGSNITSATLVCNSSPIFLTPAQYAGGGVTINEGSVHTGTNITCILTPSNATGAGASVASNPFTSQTTACTPSAVTISTSPASCVNTGSTFNLSWTDTDSASGATINVTGTDGYSYSGTMLNPAPPISRTAPATSGSITYTATDPTSGNSANPPATLTVMTAPVAPVLSITSPATATYVSTSAPESLSFSWTTTGITSATLTGTDGSSVTSSTGTATVTPAPTVANTYQYSVSATGGCSGTPAVTSNTVSVVVTSPSPSPSPSPSSGGGSAGCALCGPNTYFCGASMTNGEGGGPCFSTPDSCSETCSATDISGTIDVGPNLNSIYYCTYNGSCAPVTCGSANGQILATTPSGAALCSDGSTPSVSGSGPWNWSCGSGSGTATCQALLAGSAAAATLCNQGVPGNYGPYSSSGGAPLCGVLGSVGGVNFDTNNCGSCPAGCTPMSQSLFIDAGDSGNFGANFTYCSGAALGQLCGCNNESGVTNCIGPPCATGSCLPGSGGAYTCQAL